jgi:transcription elongation regulator 1
MYWDDFRRKFKDDPRFKALHVTKEKEALFKEHVKYNLNKQRDQVEEYINLLRETKEIKSGIRWRDAKQWLEHDERYLLLDKDKREDVFRDYLDDI